MDYEFSSAISSPVLVIGAAVQDIVGITRGNLSPGTSNPGTGTPAPGDGVGDASLFQREAGKRSLGRLKDQILQLY